MLQIGNYFPTVSAFPNVGTGMTRKSADKIVFYYTCWSAYDTQVIANKPDLVEYSTPQAACEKVKFISFDLYYEMKTFLVWLLWSTAIVHANVISLQKISKLPKIEAKRSNSGSVSSHFHDVIATVITFVYTD
jgi:hypothetical protein